MIANNLDQNELKIQLKVYSNTPWSKAGLQIWRASFLLVDYILFNKMSYVDSVALELGAGCGLVSIVASHFCRRIISTDHDNEALMLAQENFLLNSKENILCRNLDWRVSPIDCVFNTAQDDRFCWKLADKILWGSVNYIFASDVLYDDDIATYFLDFLFAYMEKNCDVAVVIAVEMRINFSEYTLCEVSLGYDAFRERICPHSQEKKNQCKDASCISKKKFLAQPVCVSDIPQYVKYDRVSTLKLWKIISIVQE